jgi:hypothetical protein
LVAGILKIILRRREKWPYQKKEYLLTRAEKDFFFVLQEIIGNDSLIFSKVRLLDILYIPKGIESREYYRYLNKIQSKHVDFLLCDRENIKPLLAIELDDSSHLHPSRIERDNFIDKIFENAKLPILHIKYSKGYDREKLGQQIKTAIT